MKLNQLFSPGRHGAPENQSSGRTITKENIVEESSLLSLGAQLFSPNKRKNNGLTTSTTTTKKSFSASLHSISSGNDADTYTLSTNSSNSWDDMEEEDHVLIIEDDENTHKNNARLLKKKNIRLGNELKKTKKKLNKSERIRTDLQKRCNVLENNITKCANDSLLIKDLRLKCSSLHEKKAEMEMDFMNQLNTLSMDMRQKEMEFENVLEAKDDQIFMLETKLSSFEKEVPPSVLQLRNDMEDDRSLDSVDLQKTSSHRVDDLLIESASSFDSAVEESKKTIRHLEQSLVKSREKNELLSEESSKLLRVIQELEIKCAMIPDLKLQLEQSQAALHSFRRANSLLTDLDKDQDKQLCQNLLNSSIEEEEFLSELKHLEMDFSADLEKLEQRLSKADLDDVSEEEGVEEEECDEEEVNDVVLSEIKQEVKDHAIIRVEPVDCGKRKCEIPESEFLDNDCDKENMDSSKNIDDEKGVIDTSPMTEKMKSDREEVQEVSFNYENEEFDLELHEI